MRLSMMEILDAHRGIPALVESLLLAGEVQRALDLGTMSRKLRPEVEVFEINRGALVNAYGVIDRDSRRKELMADSEQFPLYEKAMRTLLDREVSVNVDKFPVLAQEIQELERDAFIAVSAIVTLDGE